MPNDAYGRPVPSYLEEAFWTRERILSFVMQLDGLYRALGFILKRKHSERIWDKADAIREHLKAAKRLVLRGTPFLPCECEDIRTCGKCRGTGWITVEQWALAPEKIQKRWRKSVVDSLQPPDLQSCPMVRDLLSHSALRLGISSFLSTPTENSPLSSVEPPSQTTS